MFHYFQIDLRFLTNQLNQTNLCYLMYQKNPWTPKIPSNQNYL